MAMGTDQSKQSSLWREPAFGRLWAGQTVSFFGTWLGALSLLAIVMLEATPAQMGLLETLATLPAVVLGLFAGVLVDRMRRRPLLVLADVGRAVILGGAAAAAFVGVLQITHLFVVVLFTGSLTVLYNIANDAYLPSVVKRERLVEANSTISATESVAESVSPGLGGVLVQVVGAPLTLLIDAMTFLASALLIGSIRVPEVAAARPEPENEGVTNVWQEIRAGLRQVWGHEWLRPLVGSAGTFAFFGGFFAALYSLYAIKELGLSPAVVGILISTGGIGSFAGALLLPRLNARWNVGRILIASAFVYGGLNLFIPLAGVMGSKVAAAGCLLAGQILGDVFGTIYRVSELTLRQSHTPDYLLGRVNGSFSFLVQTIGIVGILTGGFLGQWLGMTMALAIAALGGLTACLWLFFAPVLRR
jgi:MFS family permease